MGVHGTTTGSIACVAIGGEGEGGFAFDGFEGFGGFSIWSAEIPQHLKCMEMEIRRLVQIEKIEKYICMEKDKIAYYNQKC